MTMTTRFRRFLSRSLTARLLGVMLISWVISCAGYVKEWHEGPDSLRKTLFISWLGDVIFFSIVGTLTAFATRLAPYLETFENRISILLQNQQGVAAEYARSVIKNIGDYAEVTVLCIELYRDGEFFRVVENATTVLRHFIPDIITLQKFPVIDRSQLANPPDKIGRIQVLSVDGEDLRPSHDELGEQVFHFELRGGKARTIKFLRQFWVRNGDPISHQTNRFTKEFSVSLTNRVGSTIYATHANGAKQEIAQGSTIQLTLLVESHSIPPDTVVYGFEVECPLLLSKAT